MSGGYMSRQIFSLTIIILISTNSLAFSRGELQLDSSQISFHTPYSLTSRTVDALLSKYSIVQNYPDSFNPEIDKNLSFKEVDFYATELSIRSQKKKFCLIAMRKEGIKKYC